MYGKKRSSNVATALELDNNKNLYTQICGGPLAEAAMAGRLFAAANVAPVTTVAGCTAAAWTGLGLANPLGSGINIIVHEFNYAEYIITTATGIIALALTSASGFADVIHGINQKYDGPSHKAYVDDGATIAPAGVIMRYVATLTHGATTVTYNPSVNVVDLKGGIILTPNSALITVTDAIQTTVLAFGFVWEEVPIVA